MVFPSPSVFVKAAVAVGAVVAIAVAASSKEAVAEATTRRIPRRVMLSFVGRGRMERREEGTEAGRGQFIAVLGPLLTATNVFTPW